MWKPQACSSGWSDTATWASVLDKSRRRDARSYSVMPTDSEFSVSRAIGRSRCPSMPETTLSLCCSHEGRSGAGCPPDPVFSAVDSPSGVNWEGVRVENPCWKGIPGCTLEELQSTPLCLECSVEYVCCVVRTGKKQCCENSFKGGLTHKPSSGTSTAQGIDTSRMIAVMRGCRPGHQTSSV